MKPTPFSYICSFRYALCATQRAFRWLSSRRRTEATLFLLCLLTLLPLTISAQISVTKFYCDETDLSARNNPQVDASGRKCALLRIETNLEDLRFEFDMLGLCGTPIYKKGEIWVYIPPGANRISLFHSKVGVLRDYVYPLHIQTLNTYIMVLQHATIETIVKHVQTEDYLVIKTEPKEAQIYVNGKFVGMGEKSILLNMFEEHTYKIELPLYYTKEGKVKMKTDGQRTELTIKLEPAFGYINIKTQPESGAQIFVNNKNLGTSPFTTDKLESGTYEVRALKEMYQPVTQIVTVTDGKTTEVTLTLKPDFAEPTFSVENNAEIWINGEKKGTSSWKGRLAAGTYSVETKLLSHRSTRKSLTIEAGNNAPITLEAPTPIYGRLSVNTTPIDCEIFLNGKSYGLSPKIINNLLIGNYNVELKKLGCSSVTKQVTIEEGKSANLEVELPTTEPQTAHLTPHTQTFTANGVSFDMILVKGGTFTMGCTNEQGNDCESNEKPAHQVILSDYYMGKFEVTQKLWKAVMGASTTLSNPSQSEGERSRTLSNPSYFKGDNLPVEQVSWNECQEFIKKLNQLTGKSFKLPTEAQWEFEARGGASTSSATAKKYAGSNTIDDVAWYSSNTNSQTRPIGQKSPNELGIYDMSGNVWEWCSDWYGTYPTGSTTNPTGATSGVSRVLRGGGWVSRARYCRVSYRNCNYPVNRHSFNGFRLSLSL